MIFTSMIAVVIFHIALFRKRGILDPISVFLISYLYYNFFTPVTMSIYDQFDVNITEEVSWISQESIDQSAILSFLGYVGYASAYYLTTMRTDFRRIGEVENLNLRTVLSDPFARGLLSAAVAMSLLTVVFFSGQLVDSMSSYESKISTNYENSIFSFIRTFALLQIAIFLNFCILISQRYSLIAACSAGFFIFISFAMYSKGPFILAILAGFCFLSRYKRLPSYASLTAMAVAGVIALVYFVPAFAVYRATGEFHLLSPDELELSAIFSDARGPFGVINFVLNGYIDVSGSPLWQSFVLWVPKFIWPGRPYDIAEIFAQQIMKNWQPGYGIGFSPLAEAYARFGTLGVPFFMMLVGGTMGMFQTALSGLLPKRIRVPVIITIGGYLAILILRGPYSGVITQNIQLWIPIIVVCALANYFAANTIKRTYRNFAAARQAAPPSSYIRPPPK